MNKETYKEDLKQLITLDEDIKKQYEFLINQDKEFIIMNLFEERLNREEVKKEIKKKNIIISSLQKELNEYNNIFKKLKKQQKGINLRRAKLNI